MRIFPRGGLYDFVCIHGMTHVIMNANTIKDDNEEVWTGNLPGRCDISDATTYSEQLFSAVSDLEWTETYKLRGKRVCDNHDLIISFLSCQVSGR